MSLAGLALWGSREWTRSGPSWALLALSLLLGPSILLATPWGVVQETGATGSLVGSIWYLSTLLGSIGGLVLLDRGRGLWAELGPGSLTAVGGGVLLVVALVHGIAAQLAVSALGAAPAISWQGGIACAGHWAAVGTFAFRVLGGTFPRACLLLGACWWLPAAVGDGGAWERLLWLFDPARHLALTQGGPATPVTSLVDTIPLVAWWVAAALLPTRSVFRR